MISISFQTLSVRDASVHCPEFLDFMVFPLIYAHTQASYPTNCYEEKVAASLLILVY